MPVLRLGADRGHDPRHVLRRALAQQPQVELDHVGIQHGHQRQRARVRADVVERDAPAHRPQLGQRAQQRLRALGQRALGDLHDEREGGPARRPGRSPSSAPASALTNSENGALRPAAQRAFERRLAARAVQLVDASLGACGREQGLRRCRAVVAAPAGQGLVADDAALAQVHDRLVDGTRCLEWPESGRLRTVSTSRLTALLDRLRGRSATCPSGAGVRSATMAHQTSGYSGTPLPKKLGDQGGAPRARPRRARRFPGGHARSAAGRRRAAATGARAGRRDRGVPRETRRTWPRGCRACGS